MGRKPAKKPEEMTELERLQKNEYLRAGECCSKRRTPIEGGKRKRRKTGNCSRINHRVFVRYSSASLNSPFDLLLSFEQLDKPDKDQGLKAEIQSILLNTREIMVIVGYI